MQDDNFHLDPNIETCLRKLLRGVHPGEMDPEVLEAVQKRLRVLYRMACLSNDLKNKRASERAIRILESPNVAPQPSNRKELKKANKTVDLVLNGIMPTDPPSPAVFQCIHKRITNSISIRDYETATKLGTIREKLRKTMSSTGSMQNLPKPKPVKRRIGLKRNTKTQTEEQKEKIQDPPIEESQPKEVEEDPIEVFPLEPTQKADPTQQDIHEDVEISEEPNNNSESQETPLSVENTTPPNKLVEEEELRIETSDTLDHTPQNTQNETADPAEEQKVSEEEAEHMEEEENASQKEEIEEKEEEELIEEEVEEEEEKKVENREVEEEEEVESVEEGQEQIEIDCDKTEEENDKEVNEKDEEDKAEIVEDEPKELPEPEEIPSLQVVKQETAPPKEEVQLSTQTLKEYPQLTTIDGRLEMLAKRTNRLRKQEEKLVAQYQLELERVSKAREDDLAQTRQKIDAEREQFEIKKQAMLDGKSFRGSSNLRKLKENEESAAKEENFDEAERIYKQWLALEEQERIQNHAAQIKKVEAEERAFKRKKTQMIEQRMEYWNKRETDLEQKLHQDIDPIHKELEQIEKRANAIRNET